MTSRERVCTALRRETPDRVPLDIGGTTVTSMDAVPYEALKARWGIGEETVYMSRRAHLVIPDEETLRRLGVDTRALVLGAPDGRPDRHNPDGSITDEWGVTWQRADEGHHFNPVGAPLVNATRADLDRYPWPDPADPGRTRGLRERALAHRAAGYAVTLSLPVGIGHLYQYLRGYEGFLVDLMVDPSFADALLDRLLEVWLAIARSALDAVGDVVDVVMFPDDVAFQDRPMLRPDVYRRFIKPRHRQMVELIRARSEAAVLYHSCGAVATLIADFIDIGIDALNPVQVSAEGMGDTAALKRAYGDDICFWGGIDTHKVLPHGTSADVRAEVRRRIADLAEGGGYVVAAVHDIQMDVSPENIIAMAEAVQESGERVPS